MLFVLVAFKTTDNQLGPLGKPVGELPTQRCAANNGAAVVVYVLHTDFEGAAAFALSATTR
jgi:hypothetical protein